MPNDRYAAISGQQFIGGQRRAEGEASLCSLRADDGQPTGYRFHQARAGEPPPPPPPPPPPVGPGGSGVRHPARPLCAP
ncbi:hypothetical protein I5Q39_02105, partial [Serratia marcescens]|nr:hypothetical protein [Serratia marcescens]